MIPPEIPQPSAKSQEAVDKLASYMKAKAAKNPPEPKEPKGPRARSDEGRFVGVRVNDDEVPRLPIFPGQWALDDPRQRPYLVVWANGVRAVKIAPTDGGNAVLVTLTSGETYRIAMLRRRLPRGSGTTLFYLCPRCRKPRRFLYLQTLIGNELVEYLGPRCLLCAGLRFASQGRYRTRLAREFAPILGPRPRQPRDPWAVSDPRIAEKATEDRPPRGEGPEVSDDAEDADDVDLDEDEETRPYPGRPRAPKLARPRPGAGAGELSDEASALVERFAKGLTGRLSSPIQNGIRYESPFPYLKIALDWDIYQAVRIVRESGKPIATVARELDLTETAVRSWVRQAEIDAGRGTSGALTTEEREELGRLRRENRTLRMERDILKNFRARRGPSHLLDEKLGVRLR